MMIFRLVSFLAVLSCVFGQTGNDACIEFPWDQECVDYELPTVDANIDNLCSEMPYMIGCTIRTLCSDSEYSESEYCKPFSILKTLCIDMPGMNGCANYVQMCNTSSVVQQCSTRVLPVPTTMQTSNYIYAMCASHSMDGCEKCDQRTNCDLLTVYSELCMSMQDMSDCRAWKGYCSDIPDWSLCSFESNRDALPPMRMYFHTGIMDIILFREWVPRNQLGYFGSWVAIFFMEFFFEIFKALRALLERRWNKSLVRDLQKRAKGKTNGNDTEKGKDCCNDDCKPDADADEDDVTIEPVFEIGNPRFTPFRYYIDIPRACLHFIDLGWSYLVMLIAMTFNVGLFLAILAGAFCGSLVVGRFQPLYSPKAGCH